MQLKRLMHIPNLFSFIMTRTSKFEIYLRKNEEQFFSIRDSAFTVIGVHIAHAEGRSKEGCKLSTPPANITGWTNVKSSQFKRNQHLILIDSYADFLWSTGAFMLSS